jgi:amidohydrolase
MIKKIKHLARVFHSEAVAIRRHLHANPELSQQEFKTSEFICKRLESYGISYQNGIAGEGILAIIEGKNPQSKVIALRADMDALPVEEHNKISYKSINKGVMHACGHDAHVASLLITARILNELKEDFEGSIKFFFQPSEEKYPGGAIGMIDNGVLENPNVEHVFAHHVSPEIEVGKVGFASGKYMASTDEIFITVKGKGGHGGTPDLNVDSVVIAANILVSIQQIVSRIAPPGIPTVLSFGRFIADGKTNIIPDKVEMAGTLRTFDEEWRVEAHHKIRRMAESVAESLGGSVDVVIDKGYPFLVNDKKLTERSKDYAIEYLGEENVLDLSLRMTAEDFSYFAAKVPSTYYRVGVGNSKEGISSNLHTSTFNIDEKSLEISSGLMAWISVKELSNI